MPPQRGMTRRGQGLPCSDDRFLGGDLPPAVREEGLHEQRWVALLEAKLHPPHAGLVLNRTHAAIDGDAVVAGAPACAGCASASL
eukprot:2801472-Lingulodinium_polyedra.AAC.1